MTDEELVELAGKAAGIEYTLENNPLNDDALALRLAVKLGITIEFNSNWVGTTHEDIVGRAEFYEDDPCASTCRAITRAAAEIGRGME
jgi:hypothetical protein